MRVATVSDAQGSLGCKILCYLPNQKGLSGSMLPLVACYYISSAAHEAGMSPHKATVLTLCKASVLIWNPDPGSLQLSSRPCPAPGAARSP
jgi:hypothetical protein